jgi:putative FmdB family regulatory protein
LSLPKDNPVPTYEYVCDACGHAFDEWQSFSAPELEKCPQCKKKKLRRLFGSGSAILFKGSGFYETDYNRGESYSKAAKADETAAAPPPAAEAKPAETPTAAPSPPPPPKSAGKGKKGGKS